MIIRALVTDLMDRSRISAAASGVEFVRTVDALVGADLAVVDLGRVDLAALALSPGGRVIGFGSHVERARLDQARAVGVEAMPRSEFFRRVGELLADQ